MQEAAGKQEHATLLTNFSTFGANNDFPFSVCIGIIEMLSKQVLR